MICDRCLAALARLRRRARAAWKYDPLADAVIFADECATLCGECERDYHVVLNVRTQYLMGERPSPHSVATYERFRQAVPGWIGFRRNKFTAAQQRAAQGPRGAPGGGDEITDGD